MIDSGKRAGEERSRAVTGLLRICPTLALSVVAWSVCSRVLARAQSGQVSLTQLCPVQVLLMSLSCIAASSPRAFDVASRCSARIALIQPPDEIWLVTPLKHLDSRECPARCDRANDMPVVRVWLQGKDDPIVCRSREVKRAEVKHRFI